MPPARPREWKYGCSALPASWPSTRRRNPRRRWLAPFAVNQMRAPAVTTVLQNTTCQMCVNTSADHHIQFARHLMTLVGPIHKLWRRWSFTIDQTFKARARKSLERGVDGPDSVCGCRWRRCRQLSPFCAGVWKFALSTMARSFFRLAISKANNSGCAAIGRRSVVYGTRFIGDQGTHDAGRCLQADCLGIPKCR